MEAFGGVGGIGAADPAAGALGAAAGAGAGLLGVGLDDAVFGAAGLGWAALLAGIGGLAFVPAPGAVEDGAAVEGAAVEGAVLADSFPVCAKLGVAAASPEVMASNETTWWCLK